MTEMVNARLEDGTEVHVGAGYAEARGLEVVPDDAADSPRGEVDPALVDHTPVRVKLPDGGEATVGRSFAAARKLKVLDKPATDGWGSAYPAKPHIVVGLRGKQLDSALSAAGLETTGSLADRQSRLADYQASNADALANINTEGVSP